MTDWWKDFFDDDYARYGLGATDPQVIEQIVGFLISTLYLAPGSNQTVFDQCCGVGRLSLPLAARGFRVVGVDQVKSYVEQASREAASRELDCAFHCADAGEFVSPKPCDAAFNWFTSFGYSADDTQNIRMMQRVFDSLKPGGRFVLDYLNFPRMFANMQPGIISRPKLDGTPLEGLIVLQESKPDFLRGMMESDWTVIYPDGRRTVRHLATRMYLPGDLVRMLKQAGFVEPKLYGWIDGEPSAHTSKRCIVSARKPG